MCCFVKAIWNERSNNVETGCDRIVDIARLTLYEVVCLDVNEELSWTARRKILSSSVKLRLF